jgi:hypothetical protein
MKTKFCRTIFKINYIYLLTREKGDEKNKNDIILLMKKSH